MATFPLAVRNAQLDAHNAQVLARIALETSVPTTATAAGATAAGDREKLRGIPTTGVGGTIAGTDPLAAILAKDART